MTGITNYGSNPGPRVERSGGGMAAVLLGAALCLGFGLAQLRLQFAVSDLRRETIKLQARKAELRSQISCMRGEVESLKQGDRLLKLAKAELGMVQSPAQADHLTIAGDIRSRYSGALASRPAPPAEKGSLAEAVAARLGIAETAQAGEE